MNQGQLKKSEGSIGRSESVNEVKNKLVGDYVESQFVKNQSGQRSNGAASVVVHGLLVFSVMDDLKLYGRTAIELEFETRQLDPYSWYKQQLAASAQTVRLGKSAESA